MCRIRPRAEHTDLLAKSKSSAWSSLLNAISLQRAGPATRRKALETRQSVGKSSHSLSRTIVSKSSTGNIPRKGRNTEGGVGGEAASSGDAPRGVLPAAKVLRRSEAESFDGEGSEDEDMEPEGTAQV